MKNTTDRIRALGGDTSPALSPPYAPLVDPIEIERTREQLERLAKIAKMIAGAQERYFACLRNSAGVFGTYDDVRKARAALAAAGRLRQAFNNLANELQL